MSVIAKIPFELYPINKQNTYSYFENSPTIVFEFANNMQRLIKSNTLRLCGKLRIMNKQGSNQLPANKFDVTSGEVSADIQNYEQICYIDPRIGVSSCIDMVSTGDLAGSLFDQCRNYNRIVSNTIPSHNSYEDMCSYGGMLISAQPNNDCMARQCGSEIEFCLPLMTGYLQSNDFLSMERGLSISIGLAPDSMALYGTSASGFVYQISGLNLIGDYLQLSEPVKMGQQDYASYHTFNNVINASSTHNNINMNLSAVANIFQSFIPSSWTNNYGYDSFSLCKIMNSDGDGDYTLGDGLQIVTHNRGSMRYPNAYEVDERAANKDGSFQAIRSRLYLNAIAPYYNNKHVLISPTTENLTNMVDARTNDLKTPQAPDGGMQKSWKKNADGTFTRDGVSERSAFIYGTGINLDALAVRSYANYASATFNYSLASDLDNTSTQVYTFATGLTDLEQNKVGQIVAVN